MSEKITDEELNHWIQENVFQKCWHEFQHYSPNKILCIKCNALCDKFRYTNPHYCDDIAQAWKVIEKFADRRLHFKLLTKGCASGLPNARIYNRESNRIYCEVTAETMPRAICEAAKQIIEGENL